MEKGHEAVLRLQLETRLIMDFESEGTSGCEGEERVRSLEAWNWGMVRTFKQLEKMLLRGQATLIQGSRGKYMIRSLLNS